jgi:hypothetical protein
MITIRFVQGSDTISRLISLQAGVSMPFTPSHVEALSQDGQYYIGQHLTGGMQRRLVGYDTGDIAVLTDDRKADIHVPIPSTPEQEATFHTYVEGKIGQSYDWVSILGFLPTELHTHEVGRLICSAVMTDALRKCGWLQWPVTVPFHRISPRDLLFALSTHVEIPH